MKGELKRQGYSAIKLSGKKNAKTKNAPYGTRTALREKPDIRKHERKNQDRRGEPGARCKSTFHEEAFSENCRWGSESAKLRDGS